VGLLSVGAAVAAGIPGPIFTDGVYSVSACPASVKRGEARCHARLVSDARGQAVEQTSVETATPSGYGPADLRAAYGITGAGDASTVVAVVDAYGYPNAESDLAVYRATYGLPPCTSANGCFTKYNQNGQKGPYPKQFFGWARETALDLDMVSTMCPGCRIILVEATTPALTNLGAAVGMAAALGAQVISNSYGAPEDSTTLAADAAYDVPGVAVVASSGDKGYGVEFPASSPTVVAVGGTVLKRAPTLARGWKETVWPGAGSGCSLIFGKPAWQTDTSCLNRMVADVSAVASPGTPVSVYGPATGGGSTWLLLGGTSVAAPLIAGVYGVNRDPSKPNPLAAGARPYANPGALNDVTIGHNGTCVIAYFCTARTGYDGPTGLGTPKGPGAF
jgi:subtilase family serine protease